MALWFKKKKKQSLPLLTFNRAEIYEKLQAQWSVLYDLKNETSWRLLMAQIERLKNIYILDMNTLRFGKDFEVEYARQRGRIEALVAIENLVHTELSNIKQLEETKGKEKNGEKTVINEEFKRNRPQAGPSMAF